MMVVSIICSAVKREFFLQTFTHPITLTEYIYTLIN